MAIDDNLKAEALVEMQTDVTARGAQGCNISMDDLFFSFGLEDEGKGVDNQVNFGLVAAYLEGLAWVDRLDIKWATRHLILYNLDPAAGP